jgi:hypothetical protein
MQVELGPNSATITVNCESEMARWDRPRAVLFTHESQQLLYSGDLGLQWVTQTQYRQIDWSRKFVPMVSQIIRGLGKRPAR